MARPIAGVAALALLAVLLAASSGADGRDFHVGGGAGWAPNPAKGFNHWAERNRFQVNDTLVFRYKDVDAVLVVTQSHYDACNTTQPVLRLAGGESRFVLNNSGPFFFISADANRCKAGERLIVVVLAVRNNGANTPSPSLSPPPKSSSSSPTSPPPAAKPAPRALPPPPSSPKTSSSPPPVATPAPHALPLSPPPSGKNNASSPAPTPVIAPAPAGTNGASSPPPARSSAVALRSGVLACLVIAGAAFLF